MKIKKILMALFLVIIFAGFTNGDSSLHLNYESYYLEKDAMALFLNTNYEDNITQDNLTVSLSGQELPLMGLKQFKEIDFASDYLFVCDVSGSISDKKLKAIKSVLYCFAENSSQNDSMSVMSLGEQLNTKPFVNTVDDKKAQIDDIQPLHSNTNLYAGIIQAIDLMMSNDQLSPKKSLIILSDGEDYYENGYTKDEVDKKIKESNIPVYTINISNEKTSKEMIEKAKIFGSFARTSAGGVDLNYKISEVDSNTVYTNIKTNIDNSYIGAFDLTGVQLNQDESLLEINLNIPNIGNVSQSVKVNSSQFLSYITKSSLSSTTESKKETESKEETTRKGENNTNTIIYIIIAVVVLAGICVLVVINLKKNKTVVKQVQEESSTQPQNHNTVAVNRNFPNAHKIKVVFYKVGSAKNENYSFDISDYLIIGRSKEKCKFSISNDSLLSSTHCKISFINNKLYIEDLHSTNGTFLNGIPVAQMTQINSDDILLIGSMELRICFLI